MLPPGALRSRKKCELMIGGVRQARDRAVELDVGRATTIVVPRHKGVRRPPGKRQVTRWFWQRVGTGVPRNQTHRLDERTHCCTKRRILAELSPSTSTTTSPSPLPQPPSGFSSSLLTGPLAGVAVLGGVVPRNTAAGPGSWRSAVSCPAVPRCCRRMASRLRCCS